MSDKVDILTKLLNQALDVLFAKYPTRTGLGVILGGVFWFLTKLFSPLLRDFTAIDINNNSLWGWLFVGMVIMHMPTIISAFRQNSIGNEEIDQALELINRGNFTNIERRQLFRNLIEKVCNKIALSATTRTEVQKIQTELTSNSDDQK